MNLTQKSVKELCADEDGFYKMADSVKVRQFVKGERIMT